VISHSFAFSVSRRLKFSYESILPCTAFSSTLVSMLELSPSLLVLLLLRVGGLSRLNTQAVELHYASADLWGAEATKYCTHTTSMAVWLHRVESRARRRGRRVMIWERQKEREH
jgi:hypothetical protein